MCSEVWNYESYLGHVQRRDMQLQEKLHQTSFSSQSYSLIQKVICWWLSSKSLAHDSVNTWACWLLFIYTQIRVSSSSCPQTNHIHFQLSLISAFLFLGNALFYTQQWVRLNFSLFGLCGRKSEALLCTQLQDVMLTIYWKQFMQD